MRRQLTWLVLLCASVLFSQAVQAQSPQSWQAFDGAESQDHAIQVIAFLPNEMWIHPGDSIT